MLSHDDKKLKAMLAKAERQHQLNEGNIAKLQEELKPLNEFILRSKPMFHNFGGVTIPMDNETYEVTQETQDKFNSLQAEVARLRTKGITEIANQIGEYIEENCANDFELYTFWNTCPSNTIWDNIAISMGPKCGKRISKLYWKFDEFYKGKYSCDVGCVGIENCDFRCDENFRKEVMGEAAS